MILIVRKEEDGLRYYTHLGTGNYHAGTARTYTDFGLISARPEIAVDVQRIFLQLTGLGKFSALNKLLQSQLKHRQAGIISRRILVTLNTLLLSIIVASSQFLSPQPDYRQYSWQQTITYSASYSQASCEIIAPLVRLKAVKDAVGTFLGTQSGVWNRPLRGTLA